MRRVSEENINTAPFWNHVWDVEPPWRPGFGVDPARFGAMAEVLYKLRPGVGDRLRVLDVGGGRGEFLGWAAGKRALVDPFTPCRFYLADISSFGPAEAVREERADAGVQAEASALPFADSKFDVVFAGEILEHLDDPAAMVSELYRVCRPGGWLSLSTPLRDAYPDVQHVWEFEPEDVRLLLYDRFRTGRLRVRELGGYIVAHAEKKR